VVGTCNVLLTLRMCEAISPVPYVFKAWYLDKHRDTFNSTFTRLEGV